MLRVDRLLGIGDPRTGPPARVAWLTQKALAELFGVKVPAVAKHLKHIFDSGELSRAATVSKMEMKETKAPGPGKRSKTR